MRIEEGHKIGFRNVIIRPKRSTLRSRNDVSLIRKFTFLHSKKTLECVPIIASNMDTIGTLSMAEALASQQMLTCLQKFIPINEIVNFCNKNPTLVKYIAVSSGTSADDFQRLKDVIRETPIEIICLDVANGYCDYFEQFVRTVRAEFPTCIIIAGNVVTSDMTQQLILAGADIVKVGIGGGSVCTTRVETGVGYPQLSAVIECADAANGLGAHIISDGGCASTGDICKAFGGGAHFVMLGGMFSGHDECEGKIMELADGKKVMEFYGMSSAEAMHKYYNGVADYRTSEGKRVLVTYRGSVIDTAKKIMGGLRSSCTYIGAREIREFSKCTTFVLVTEQENNVFS